MTCACIGNKDDTEILRACQLHAQWAKGYAVEPASRALLVAAHEVLSEVDITFMLAHPSEELCERVRRNRLIALVVAIDAIQEGGQGGHGG